MGQLFVIVFTVTIVTALFFATLTLRDVFYNIQLSMATRLPGEAQIAVSGEIISEYELNEALSGVSDVEYVDEFLDLTALLRTTKDGKVDENVVMIESTDLETYIQRHSDKLFYKTGISSDMHYSYPEVWMSADFAEENGLNVGDEVELFVSMYNTYQKFIVTYLFESEGIFANTALNTVMTDFSSLGNRGLITNAYVKLSNESLVDETIDFLSDTLGSEIKVERAVDYDHIESVVSGNQKLITIVMFFVLALVLFILFSSYLVIFQKRRKELYIFKAAGATVWQCILILVFEGLFYGLTGAILGTVLGRFTMQIVEITVIPNFSGAIQYHTYHYVSSLLLGISVSAVCAFFPAFLFVKRSVKSAEKKPIKNSIESTIVLLFLLMVLFICIALTLIFIQYIVYFSIILILIIALFIYFGTPYLVSLISNVFSAPRGMIKLASSSVKRNRNTARLPAIVAAVISFSFIAVSIVSIVIGAIEPYYTHFRGDFVVQSLSSTDMVNVNTKILDSYGVERTVYLRSVKNKMQADGKTIEFTLYGVAAMSDIDNVTTGITAQQKERFFTEDDTIILSYDMANRMGVEVGDKIRIPVGTMQKRYTVIGIDNTITKDDRVCFIVNKDDEIFEDTLILVISDKNVSNMDLYKDLSEKLHKDSCYIMFYNQWTNSTNVGISGIELLLRLLQVLIGGVAFIGVINMTVSTLLERRREFNIYFSAGSDKINHFFLSLFEGIIFSLTGGIIGFLFSFTINILLPEFGKLIDRYVAYDVLPLSIPAVVTTIMVAYTVLYVIISMRIRKKVAIERNIL